MYPKQRYRRRWRAPNQAKACSPYFKILNLPRWLKIVCSCSRIWRNWMFWEDFTCLDISQCTLNKTILHVAAKYLDSDVSGNLVQFIALGTKANIWCRKHLKMTLMSLEDSPEEEHSSFFYQLVLDLLSYSTASYTALARYPASTSKKLVDNLECFISEQFALMKDLVSEIKRIPLLGSELLKAAQVALDSMTRLCKVYCNGVNWDTYLGNAEKENAKDCKETENGDFAIIVVDRAVEKLCELGTVAASDGGTLVSLLNMSWKGVVSLLQFGKGSLAAKVNIAGVIMNLISLASESLKCAAECWSSMEENVSVIEAKRIFLPVKFYLINAVRIISQYQIQAFSVFKEISHCVVKILAFRISLSMVDHLKSVSEVLAEILEPTSLHLLNSLLNSSQLKQENKFKILDWLFNTESDMTSQAENNNSSFSSSDVIFSVSDSMNKEKMLSIGQVALYLNLLMGSVDLEDDTKLGIAKRLDWLMDTIVDEDVYSSVLVLQVPTPLVSGRNGESTHHPMFCAILHALKTFMIVAFSTPAWNEVELFLIKNLFHPHFLCWEIITELWCFLTRHGEQDMVNDIVDKLCVVLLLTSQEPVLFCQNGLRKIARLISILATYGPEFMADQFYSSIFETGRSQYVLNVHVALLMEGFPLNSLSERNRSNAKERIVTQYYNFLESFEDNSPGGSDSLVYGTPISALCAALKSLQVSLSDSDIKTLRFLVSIICKCKTASNSAIMDKYGTLLGELLGIVSCMKHLYSSDEMEDVVLELQNLFISKSTASHAKLFLCKPNLAHFMAGLAHMSLPDSDGSAKSSAAWKLYHMLLRERHWAFIHIVITAFGYFAAHTSCNQLWRFVPQDAALSFDLESGNAADEERFMSELKAVLEKEMACTTIQASSDQLKILAKEGQLLKEKFHKIIRHDSEYKLPDIMDIDDEKQPNKKRKFPDGINKGVELLQSGLQVMVDSLSQWQQNQHGSAEVHEKFLIHFSKLEEAIVLLTSLADSS
ncbi:uncharacterized protein LOC127242747 isoform X2 [Andrographis paniculata]|uniref:uncharacterized protein LOC127242747 isoform X2 n=1 Tax=Andrographis paniculata TaxID=175694 RepID=UPI0021E8DBD9|nr:uncharacterized protein LOC127242747 isoform X2 [Andrographis paniculata]